MTEETSKSKELKEQLFMKHPNGAATLSKEELQKAYDFCEGYKAFLGESKIEREAVIYMVNKAKSLGYQEFDRNKKYLPGEKVYYNNRGKSIVLAVIGTEPLSKGVRLSAAHIDSPRLDLKPSPLYEDHELALFKTHYYGGIKKYQWTTIPLAIHGALVKKNGETILVHIGEDENDPQFLVNDLLPHLGQEQMKRTLADGIRGEELNLLVGSQPFSDEEEAEQVKLNILHILFEKYGITEADFLSAELEIVPAAKPKDIGFDRSMIGGYGHDDKVCAYPAAEAIFATEHPKFTCVTCLTDKEEIGSEGNTGLNSAYLRYFIADLAKANGENYHTVLSNSKCLSADVNAAFDPTFPEVMEQKNAAYLNKGVTITKYTGARGKSGTSDASAEFMAEIRALLDDNDVVWQSAELGAVDAGGGGTVAMYLAAQNIDVVDLGVPVLSMHAPCEVVAKVDVYMAYKAFKAFFEN